MAGAFISTAKERCRVCYTCVRECPAKAIRIADGQAEVLPERCIACGNCVSVCSQDAKLIRNTVEPVERLLASGQRVFAMIAPSYPAEFTQADDRHLVGMVRKLGFERVLEVAFGADLVARRYRELLSGQNGRRYIATSCPAVVGYVERYHPNLVDSLAPIVSPMIAAARSTRERYGDDIRMVFVGPCIAKKVEANAEPVAGEIDAVITFQELSEMLAAAGITPDTIEPSDFDGPHGAAGALFPIGRGMLQAAEIPEDLLTGEVVAAEGRSHVIEAIREFESGDLGARLLELLCCEGCIMGAGISNELPLFNRRSHVRRAVCKRMERLDYEQWKDDMRDCAELDLARTYQINDQRIRTPERAELIEIMQRLGKHTPDDELNCGACGYDTCREHAIAIYKGLAENEMCLPQTIDRLQTALQDVEVSNQQLASAQEALVQSEKLASMGQLAAGIAHEVNNPLGVVLMYAHLLLEEREEDDETGEDLRMIVEQADRCKKIVAGLLHFARQNKVIRNPSDVPKMLDRVLRAIPIPDSIQVDTQIEMENKIAEIDRDQVMQVLTNLITNGVAAMENGGTLTVGARDENGRIYLTVADTGVGIPDENRKKIFEPFFTTKQMGKGTGLGLSVTYGIVKMHSGDIKVESNADPKKGPTGTTFTVSLPRME